LFLIILCITTNFLVNMDLNMTQDGESMKLIKQKANLIWIRSFIIVIILILIVISILTTWTIHRFKEEIIGLNYNLMLKVQQNIETNLMEIEKITSMLELDSTNLAIKKSTAYETLNQEELFQFHHQINNYKISNRFISNIYIYYPKIDLIVSDKGIYPSKSYYLLYNNLNREGYNTWLSNVASTSDKGYYIRQKNGDALLYMHSQLPYNIASKKDAILTIEINQDELLTALYVDSDIRVDSHTTLFDSSNTNVSFFGNTTALELLRNVPESFLHNDGIYEYHRNFIITQTSRYSNIHYLTWLNSAEILAITHNIRFISYVSIIICLLIGAYISIRLTQHNNIPLYGILEKLSQTNPNCGKDAINEYDLINFEIDTMTVQNLKNRERLNHQQTLIESLFLSSILDRSLLEKSMITNKAKHYDVVFEYDFFQVLLIRPIFDETMDLQLFQTHLFSGLEYLQHTYGDMYIIGTLYNKDLVYLINSPQKNSAHTIEEMATNVLPLFSELGECIACLGQAYHGMESIGNSYAEALEVAPQHVRSSQNLYIYDPSTCPQASPSKKITLSTPEKAKRYIDAHYTDPLLGLYLIADKLKVSNTHLSSCFKETFGIGIIQYINQRRIDYAKELILTSDLLVKDIAQHVGFSSDISFIRVFKQYEKTTPGKFKDKNTH